MSDLYNILPEEFPELLPLVSEVGMIVNRKEQILKICLLLLEDVNAHEEVANLAATFGISKINDVYNIPGVKEFIRKISPSVEWDMFATASFCLHILEDNNMHNSMIEFEKQFELEE